MTADPARCDPAAPLRILVVDDYGPTRKILKDVLETEGYRVIAARLGREGLQIVGREHLDVALIDIGLPDLPGYQVAEQIRANPAQAGIYLIAISGYAQPEDQQRALEAGFDLHLAKPLDPPELLRLLAERKQIKDADR